MDILRLAPLVRRLREQVEAGTVPLEESVRDLSIASELVLFKVRWLLPIPQAETPEEEEEIVESEGLLEAATTLQVMEPWEVAKATDWLREAMDTSRLQFTRGNAALVGDRRRVVVSSIDPGELRKAMLGVMARQAPKEPRIVLPRWSFVSHLRTFWREVRRLASRGGVLRLSRFLGKTRMEAILNFLAFLELVKRRRLYARQRSLFGEILFSPDRKDILDEEVESGE
ncbi:MAG TPA: hypothetical protein GX512_00505 [Firmicutes bacterium]|nr:hypothetical protein [Candidatus Fermentithermobacillaceae bacterium]